MLRFTCHNCNSPIEIEAATEDASLRELLALLGRRPAVGGYLVPYLQLFKPRRQSLRSSRALFLAGEVLALSDDDTRLAAALVETVESLREKRQLESWRPLKNHAYLSRVLESVTFRPPVAPAPAGGRAGQGASRTAIAIDNVETFRLARLKESEHDYEMNVTNSVCFGFQSWLKRSLEGVPPADLIADVARQWIDDIVPARKWDPRSVGNLQHGFKQLGQQAKRWPTVQDVLGFVPRIGRR